MPTKRISPAKSPAEQKIEAPREQHPIGDQDAAPARFTSFALKIFAEVKERLESEFESFVESSTVEEQRLLIEILNDQTNRSVGGQPRSPGEYEVPLYSAIERQISGRLCVVVPNEDMVPKVEAFISELARRRSPKAPPYKPETEEQVEERLETQFRNEVELFARDARRPSLNLMLDFLARWNQISNDPQMEKLPNTLAIAAEIELDKLRARTAAEKA